MKGGKIVLSDNFILKVSPSDKRYYFYNLGNSLARMVWAATAENHFVSQHDFLLVADQLFTDKDAFEQIKKLSLEFRGAETSIDNLKLIMMKNTGLLGIIEKKCGTLNAAAYNLGFNIINMLPQLKLLFLIQQGDEIHDSLDRFYLNLKHQFQDMIHDAQKNGLTCRIVSLLCNTYVQTHDCAEGARLNLIATGKLIVHELLTLPYREYGSFLNEDDECIQGERIHEY